MNSHLDQARLKLGKVAIFVDISGSESWVDNPTIRREGPWMVLAYSLVAERLPRWQLWCERHKARGGVVHAAENRTPEGDAKNQRDMAELACMASSIVIVHRPSLLRFVTEQMGSVPGSFDITRALLPILNGGICGMADMFANALGCNYRELVDRVTINTPAGGKKEQQAVEEVVGKLTGIRVEYASKGNVGVDFCDVLADIFRRFMNGKGALPWTEIPPQIRVQVIVDEIPGQTVTEKAALSEMATKLS